MALTDARKRANAKYKAKAYDKVELRLYKGDRDVLKAKAEAQGKSVNSYILELLEKEIPELRH